MKKKIILNGIEVAEFEASGDIEKDIFSSREVLKKKGIYKEITTIESMFRQASSFASIAENIYQNYLEKSPINFLGAVPFVVNSVFSIEIYLKLLNFHFRNKIKVHTLVDLYDALPSEAHKIISNIIPKFSNIYKLSESENFRDIIFEINNSFVDWRYCYEEGKVGTVKIFPTILIITVLHEACKNITKK